MLKPRFWYTAAPRPMADGGIGFVVTSYRPENGYRPLRKQAVTHTGKAREQVLAGYMRWSLNETGSRQLAEDWADRIMDEAMRALMSNRVVRHIAKPEHAEAKVDWRTAR